MLTESINELLKMYPGSMVCERVQTSEDSHEVVFGLKEESKRIHQLGPDPEVEFRPGVISEYGILLIPLFIRLGPLSRESLFLKWIDPHDAEGKEILRLLGSQSHIRLELYDAQPEPDRVITIENPHRVFLTDSLIDAQAMRPWAPNQFEAAKEVLFNKRPTAVDIWWTI